MQSSTPPVQDEEPKPAALVLPSCQKLFEEVELREEARFASLPRSPLPSPPAPFSFAFGPLSSSSSAYTTWKEDQHLRSSVSYGNEGNRSSRASSSPYYRAKSRVVPYVPLASLYSQDPLPPSFKPRTLQQSDFSARLPFPHSIHSTADKVPHHSNTYLYNRRLPSGSTSSGPSKSSLLPPVSVKTPPLIAPLTVPVPPSPSISDHSPPSSPPSSASPPSKPSIYSKANRRKPSTFLPKNKSCPHCPALFARKNDLTRHIYIHTDERYVPIVFFC